MLHAYFDFALYLGQHFDAKLGNYCKFKMEKYRSTELYKSMTWQNFQIHSPF